MRTKDIFKKKPKTKENASFAEFFRNASPKEQAEVFTKAAQMANEDQRRMMQTVGVR